MKHVLSVQQFTDKKLLTEIFDTAAMFQNLNPDQYPKPLRHKTVATIFYEPSTRTRLSFETAIQNLGGQLITTENAGEFSSAIKGESLEDTTQVINAFADGMVLRHHEVGAAKRAAAVSGIPVINAGDGTGEHPTQALLDVYSIQKAKGKIDGLKVALVGDLLYGRTVHSLIPLLAMYDVEFYFIAPDDLQMPKEYLDQLDAQSVPYKLLDSWKDVIGSTDVLYMTRIQKERFKSEAEYKALKDSFILTPKDVSQMKKDSIILHPLPRVNEIDPAVDGDPRARYFEQVKNGLFLRMSLLNKLYGGTLKP
ncbi:MAG TPA: aspartate carbamoyltransferase [Candidatus Dormibacteraeota bacterium]|nr:aspartate carbamoyltransferase [Candidatus Dormibacteraeota bacterium]